MGAWNCFYLVAGAAVPAVIPFLFIRANPFYALRVSNHLHVYVAIALGG